MPAFTCSRLLLLCLIGIMRTLAAADAPPSSVRDLQYGEVLYHYFQQDYFNSIVRLQIAQQQQRLPNHAAEAELMLGGLDLSYGLRDEANRIFQRLLSDETSDVSTRNRALFYLAKISWQRGDMTAALQAIERVQGSMTAATRTAAINLHSLLLLQQGNNQAAISLLLDARSGQRWTPFLNYNLGIALIRDQQQQQGAKQLDRIGDIHGRDEELRLLRDKANLALGYSYLQDGNPEMARKTLERVRLEGPLSNRALLGTGWANSDSENFAAALVPWLELSSRDSTDPAVQESLLAIPYAMTKMNLHGRAVQHYNDGIRQLIEERQKLDQSIHAIRQGGLLNLLQQHDLGAGNGWMQQLHLDSEAPALRYQLTLMSSHDFQEAVKNYRDLLVLKDNLSGWKNAIAAYDDMLAGRQARYETHRPEAQQALQGTRLQQLQQRRDALAEDLARIETTGDAAALANPEEARQWQQLATIGERLAQLPDNSDTAILRDKQQRLRGILVWQFQNDYKSRLWQARKQLTELDTLIAGSQQGIDSLQQANLDAPSGFGDFKLRIAGNRASIQELSAQTDTTLLAQGRQLEHLAVNELEQQQQRIDAYIIQARFALAQTYDDALQQPAGEGSVQ
ncbi:MAG: tetratricopeptide repeat protein [Gammaproteobacteria bacterium]